MALQEYRGLREPESEKYDFEYAAKRLRQLRGGLDVLFSAALKDGDGLPFGAETTLSFIELLEDLAGEVRDYMYSSPRQRGEPETWIEFYRQQRARLEALAGRGDSTNGEYAAKLREFDREVEEFVKNGGLTNGHGQEASH